jgi:hypothetical protein
MHNEQRHAEHSPPKLVFAIDLDIKCAQSDILYNHFTSAIWSKTYTRIVYTPLRTNNAAHIVLRTVTKQHGLCIRNVRTMSRGCCGIAKYVFFQKKSHYTFLHTRTHSLSEEDITHTYTPQNFTTKTKSPTLSLKLPAFSNYLCPPFRTRFQLCCSSEFLLNPARRACF